MNDDTYNLYINNYLKGVSTMELPFVKSSPYITLLKATHSNESVLNDAGHVNQL